MIFRCWLKFKFWGLGSLNVILIFVRNNFNIHSDILAVRYNPYSLGVKFGTGVDCLTGMDHFSPRIGSSKDLFKTRGTLMGSGSKLFLNNS